MKMDLTLNNGEQERRGCKDWDGEHDKDDPKNWSPTRKILSTTIICFIGFVTTMGASIYAPGHEQVKAQFGVSTTVSLLPLSSYSLGLAFGPMISSPLSETFGRKFVYLSTLPLLDIFMLGSGFSQSIAALIICRFFAGIFAAPGVSVAAATITDYTRSPKRAVALAPYYTIPFIGSAIGPLIGGFAVERKGWRWTAWVTLMFAAVVHPPALYLRESYKLIVLQNKAKVLGVEGPEGPYRSVGETIKAFVTSTITRPLHMLITEPLVGYICLYTGFQFALLYTFVVASPWVFATVYNFSVSAQGLSFLGLVTGCCIAPFLIVAIDRFFYQPRLALVRNHSDPDLRSPRLPPEMRLLGALYGSLILPVGLFWFAFTARPNIHWLVPIAAQAVTILGSILIYVPCNFYMLEVYGSKYGASASGASSLSRYTLSAAFPLFVTQMYERLGVKGATGLLGGLSLVLAVIPWIFYWKGPALRARSLYEHESGG
jgi:MFS transporter, DHA1 family, multidrug resistance protein